MAYGPRKKIDDESSKRLFGNCKIAIVQKKVFRQSFNFSPQLI